MPRRCSHCTNNGHNSRTCPSRSGGGSSGGVRLFGVRLTEGVGAMKKSASMGCLNSVSASLVAAGMSSSGGDVGGVQLSDGVGGYVSDDPNCRSERKKGVPWTEEEHRMFLLGLQKLGKGDWRGIARNYVVSRTPTQVASHAQKYFIRQTNTTRRKRRSSLFDMVPEMPSDEATANDEQSLPSSPNELEKANQPPSLQLGLQQKHEIVESSTANRAHELGEGITYNNNQVTMAPAFYHAFIPVPLPFWVPTVTTIEKENAAADRNMADAHEILKPVPIAKEPRSMDEVASMSKLSIDEHAASCSDTCALSLEVLGTSSSRQSAFHISSPSITGPDLNQSSGSPIHAV